MLEVLEAGRPLPARVRLFFTTRRGGVSDAPYHTLNLSFHVGDDADAVYENRMRLREHLPAEPKWLRQAHGSRVLPADNIQNDADIADASHTSTPNVVCAVQTADCLPVLFFHEDGGGVGGAHAGWRGLAAGVLQNTAAAMRAQNPSPLCAVIGPHIGARHYVVGDDVRAQLAQNKEDNAAFARAGEGKWRADLARLAVNRLRAAGVADVHVEEQCTYEEEDIFFSARRKAKTGRQAAVIYIAG